MCVCVCVSARVRYYSEDLEAIWERVEEEDTQTEKEERKNFQQTFQNENEKRILII